MDQNRTDPCAVYLQEALVKVATEREGELISAIEPIVWVNWETGRAGKFIGEVNAERCEEYVNRIADIYVEWHNRVCRLRIEKEAGEWKDLFTQLQKWAYAFLRKKNFPAYGRQRRQHAVDCATEAAGRLLGARFPYDVDFHCWVYVLLQKTCLNHMRRHIQPTSVPPHKQVEFEDSASFQGHAEKTDEIQRVERIQDLEQEVRKLSPDRRKFIRLFYFEARTFEEISRMMNCSINSLYKLHYDALKALGKKSGKNRQNNE
jgi:RNA polymerase sigma factor (sigma-70 family)